MKETPARELRDGESEIEMSARASAWEAEEAELARLRAEGDGEDEMPRISITRQQAVAFALFILSGVAFLYFVLPKLAGIGMTVRRIERGDSWWIAAAVVFEVLSFAGYVVLFRAVFVRGRGRIGWRESYQITMAGLAASRLFAAAGAGGVALTAWALRRSGMESRMVACRMVAFMVLLYVIYCGSLLLDGIGLGTGVFPGGGSFAITFVPAIVAVGLFAIAGALALIPGDIERRIQRRASGSGRVAHALARGVAAPAMASSGVRTAIDLVRARNAGILGAPAWWGFDICVLWASFHAFGSPPPFTVIWMAYFVGMLGNLLPLPGGLGGVEGGMIGAFAAFGVDFNLSVVAVLAYRGIAFWLPTIPGALAYLQLRRTVARWREGESESERKTREHRRLLPLR
ncbi:MAG TPA: lysylphosphatidylglycerol synthase transmembrane domain-containing protein [Solirubrobacteraceae bacterium]|nr:lysylphosphatidylglycerol synthase transmembrane domain-containing protein [Solirubrobacteraceae bacterium]